MGVNATRFPFRASALLLAPTTLALSIAPEAQEQFAERGLRRYLPISTGAEGIAFSDVENDGDEDLIRIGPGARLQVFVNDGTGILVDQTATRVPPRPGFLRGLAVGDVDGDGDEDIATGDALFVNSGHGVFLDRSASLLPDGSPPGGDVELVDLDGDGDLDLVFTPYLASGLRLYVNDGTGHFANESAQNWPSTSTYGNVEFGDIDGDGDLDALTSPITPELYENDGNGVFTDVSAQLPAFGSTVVDERFLDADLDGDLDVLIAEHTGNDILWRNDGSGTFAAVAGSVPSIGGFGGRLAIGDFDGDGDPDAARGSRLTATRLYENDGTGMFSVSASLVPGRVNHDHPLAFGDVDGDGDLDLYLGVHRLLFNDGAGDFYDAPTRRFDDLAGVVMATADLNGDGNEDVVTGGGYALIQVGESFVHLSNGPGTRYTRQSLGYWNTWALATGDVDGDGDIDIVEGNSTDGGYFTTYYSNRVRLNDGTGQFSVSGGLPTDTDDTKAIVLFDLEGDGDLDLMSGNDSQQDRIYVNQGGGTFVLDASRLPALQTSTYGLAVGDVDGDGDADVVTAAYGAQNRLYLNDGEGMFEDASAARMPVDNASSRAVALADIEGDGDLDIVIANESSASALYLNDGTGTFADVSERIPNTGSARAVAVADIDEDGDVDLLISRFAPGGSKLFVNQGTGFFVDGSARLPAIPTNPLAIVFADLDRDRDLDLLLGFDPASYNAGILLVNLHRQLDARRFAIPGRAYELELSAEPDYASGDRFAIVAFGSGLLEPPVSNPGRLRGLLFLAAPLTSLPIVMLPMAGGTTRIDLVAPNEPSLLGYTFYGQAAILGGGKPQLTGYVLDTFRM